GRDTGSTPAGDGLAHEGLQLLVREPAAEAAVILPAVRQLIDPRTRRDGRGPAVGAGPVRAAAAGGTADHVRLEVFRRAGVVGVVVHAGVVVVHGFDTQGVVVGAEGGVDGGSPLPLDRDHGGGAGGEQTTRGDRLDPAGQVGRHLEGQAGEE